MSQCRATWRHPTHCSTSSRSRAWRLILLPQAAIHPMAGGKGYAKPELGEPSHARDGGYVVEEPHPVPIFFGQHGATLGHRAPPGDFPDRQDGCSSCARIVLRCLHARHQARDGRHLPTGILYRSGVKESGLRIEGEPRLPGVMEPQGAFSHPDCWTIELQTRMATIMGYIGGHQGPA
jgi:hypothetical protein